MGCKQVAQRSQDNQLLGRSSLRNKSAFKPIPIPSSKNRGDDVPIKSLNGTTKVVRIVEISTEKPPEVKFKPINYTAAAQTLGSDNAPNPTAAPTPYSKAPSTPNPTETLQNNERLVKEVEAGMTGLTVRSFEPKKLFQN